jgi:hypothetical protein
MDWRTASGVSQHRLEISKVYGSPDRNPCLSASGGEPVSKVYSSPDADDPPVAHVSID